MSNENELKKQVVLKAEVTVLKDNQKQCSPRCQYAEKEQGTYWCQLYRFEIDHGDDEITGEPIFKRSKNCIETAKDF